MKYEPKPVPHLRHGIYYTITNCANGLALSMPKTNKFSKDKPQFVPCDPNNINQIWMLQQISPNRYEIVHALSTLVLQCIPGNNKCKLQFGKWKNTQLYFIQEDFDTGKFKGSFVQLKKQNQRGYSPPNLMQLKMDEQKQQKIQQNARRQNEKYERKSTVFKAGERLVARVRIKESERSAKYLYCQKSVKSSMGPSIQSNIAVKSTDSKINTLKFMQIDILSQPHSTLWEITEVKTQQNQMLAKTCYISSYRSGMVLDVPEASDKPGTQIIQYPCNFKFNQKWILKKVDEVNGYGFYMISNAKNGLFLDIEAESTKQGVPIIQWENHEGKNQIWRLEEQGKRTYLIRSALDKDLLIGVKDNSLKQNTPIVTSKADTNCFWVIHGCIPV